MKAWSVEKHRACYSKVCHSHWHSTACVQGGQARKAGSELLGKGLVEMRCVVVWALSHRRCVFLAQGYIQISRILTLAVVRVWCNPKELWWVLNWDRGGNSFSKMSGVIRTFHSVAQEG